MFLKWSLCLNTYCEQISNKWKIWKYKKEDAVLLSMRQLSTRDQNDTGTNNSSFRSKAEIGDSLSIETKVNNIDWNRPIIVGVEDTK